MTRLFPAEIVAIIKLLVWEGAGIFERVVSLCLGSGVKRGERVMVADTCTFRNRRHALQRRLPLLCAKGVGIIALLASGSDALACPPVSFGPHVDYATGGYSISVAVADLNRDGKPDVVTANLLSDSVSVLLGKGDGTFQPKVDYATGSWPPRSRWRT
jgi:FG-GAP repeat.